MCGLKIEFQRFHCSMCEDFDACSRCYRRGSENVQKGKSKGRAKKKEKGGSRSAPIVPCCGYEGHTFERTAESAWADDYEDSDDDADDEDYRPPVPSKRRSSKKNGHPGKRKRDAADDDESPKPG